jgi:hypothetical protein
MNFDKIRLFDHFQGLAWMSPLSSAFSSGAFSQTLWAWRSLIVSIAGRRLAAVTTILRKLVFQFLYALNNCQKRGLE